ncbi:hypothetical protein OU682_20385 [Paracoccus sp. EF6]|uniref:Histidine kinase/HSP90-like ATPase domain-containing protein n=1 Tax=Paracoccus benzoatiresistens TaxID=2997341 RepID=A0ABT4JAL2_9RHOB|nr:hypothetical protein [Paracoccus sp. EF6]MCZ0963954.1 hypothetical protein [Paracoccus sp. EF6]
MVVIGTRKAAPPGSNPADAKADRRNRDLNVDLGQKGNDEVRFAIPHRLPQPDGVGGLGLGRSLAKVLFHRAQRYGGGHRIVAFRREVFDRQYGDFMPLAVEVPRKEADDLLGPAGTKTRLNDRDAPRNPTWPDVWQGWLDARTNTLL